MSATYGKRCLVLAVIREYLNRYNSTYQELSQTFYDKIQGNLGVFRITKDIKEKESNIYLTSPDEILKTNDNIEIAVCSQWERFNIDNFVNIANKAGLNIEKV